MTFSFSKRSRARLAGVHQDLIDVVSRALEITTVDFTVVEGLRSPARQRELVATGASQTMNSRHLTGHAVDLAPYIAGSVRWDWPPFYELARAMKLAAGELGIPIKWGGDWRTFKDGPHFELDRRAYP